ncbi:MAG: nitroreductase family protein [Armatimonadota bacterium]
MKEKIDFIFNRHCCRNFIKGKKLPQEHIELLMEALRAAPSAGNIQPWFFYVVKNEKIKKELAHAAFGQGFIAEADVVFVVCADPGSSASGYGRRGEELYCIQDTAAATQNLLLAASALGYGACWIGAFSPEKAAVALDVPGNLMPVSIIPVSYMNEKARITSRKDKEDIFKIIQDRE